MDDLLRDFLTESNENLTRLDGEIVALEQNPGEPELLASIFRTIHTIKGTCGFLGLGRLEAVAHSGESVLGRLRDGDLKVSQEIISDVLAAVDVIKEILAGLEQTGEEPAGDDSAVVAQLDTWLTATPGVGRKQGGATPAEAPAAEKPKKKQPAKVAAEVVAEVKAEEPPATVPEEVAVVAEVSASAEGESDVAAARPTEGGSIADSTLRVNVQILDRLMNLVGELVLMRNQLLQLTSTNEDTTFLAPVQHLNRVTTDLQEAVMKTRMQPVGNAWTKLPRLVRDLAQANGKKIELQLTGAETELDRQILQAIGDPLVHMIRNSADHGIESPDERKRKGKEEKGTIRLNAYHEGGHVILQVRDDGAGINAEVVRRKAIERGLVKADAAAAMTDAQILRFVFEPGFSTAAKVTNVSGRGVGMDVVRSNIERIGGTVDVQSAVGEGTVVRIKIPLTLAIISGLVVGAGGEAFAIPQIGILELVRVTAESKALVEDVHGARFYRLRDTLLPLVDLGETLGLEPIRAGSVYSIVVCQVGESRYGLLVAEVFDTQEIVVKPVGRMVKSLPVYAGCTILGDGRVIMILDTAGLAARGLIAQTDEQAKRAAADRAQRQAKTSDDRRSLLLFDVGRESLQAVPLALVARLEEFPAKDVEFADGRWLVQYRGALLPVIPAHEGIVVSAKDPRPVIVFTDGHRSMGLAVEGIRDIVEDRIAIETTASRAGVLGAAVINGRATEVIDTHHYLKLAHSDWFTVESDAESLKGKRVLLVDDSPFFLNMLTPVLATAGFVVETSSNGKEALERLEGGERFDVVMSDIGMPEMDGLELARRIRANPDLADVRLLAITGRESKAERKRGLDAGFSHYLVKFDRDAMVAAVHEATQMAETAAV